MQELNPSGECCGPTMQGCPDGANAMPSTGQVKNGWLISRVRYHCATCFEIYRRRYTDAPPWTGEPLP